MRRRTLLTTALAAAATPVQAAPPPIDLLLVLAIDVSRSISEQDATLQREGYRAALLDPQVLSAIQAGPIGAIAIAYVEWAAYDRQELLIPWTRIATRTDAKAWGDTLSEKPWSSITWTSLSGALRFSGRTLAAAPFEATRRVIDVSGDGVNNNGPLAEHERDRLVADGIIINGLPIINEHPRYGRPSGPGLVPYYTEAVVGGPGHFVIVAKDFSTFADAVRRKLIQEIS